MVRMLMKGIGQSLDGSHKRVVRVQGEEELQVGAQLVQNASDLVNTTGNALVQQGE